MRRREFITLLGGAAAWPLGVDAQQAGTSYRIGFLRNGSPPQTFIEGLRQGLREFGYVESQNIRIDYGLAASADELPAAAAELLRRKVDLIIASGTPPTVRRQERHDQHPDHIRGLDRPCGGEGRHEPRKARRQHHGVCRHPRRFDG